MKQKSKSLFKTLEKIGQRLSDLRKDLGYTTVKDFAKDNKLPAIQYWKIEKGKSNLTMKTLTNLLTIHRISIEDFFCAKNA